MNDIFKQLERAKEGSQHVLDGLLQAIKFNADGLVPVIAQQFDTRVVLMLAWMDKKAIEETLDTRQVCYWSRSRQAYWRKGDTSGNVQRLKEMRIDCDGDTLLILVDQQGPACHTQRPNCFYCKVDNGIVVISSD